MVMVMWTIESYTITYYHAHCSNNFYNNNKNNSIEAQQSPFTWSMGFGPSSITWNPCPPSVSPFSSPSSPSPSWSPRSRSRPSLTLSLADMEHIVM